MMAPPSGQSKLYSARISKSAPRVSRRKRIAEDHEILQKTVDELDTKNAIFTTFSDLPLSEITARGLDASHYKALTDIQSKAIPLGLQGCDILGAAKTGSGKTLAFLIPVLENLHRKRWTALDGLGALIISPTRELAIQNFEVLRKIGRYHTFSAGLIIGGKSLREERERLGGMNILVCTPGRMLQHMDQTAALEVDNLQMLVLDEADRIMDMGFQSSVDAIIKHLPRMRQTLLFSATQAKKVSDLARLSLKDAEYVSVHETSASATPSSLKQHYVITCLPEKLNTLFGFIRANLKAKILVFLSSCKQVRFVYESFRHLQPGIPILHLHGRQKQTARLDITTRFSASKNSCLFATDVVARGLDFPAVDWVIQLDCPEDADTYIHRVGRTARYERDGRAVLFLDPCEEEGMLKRLSHKRVPIEKIKVRQKKQQNIQRQLQNMCFKDPELKYLGQKAFISYSRSIFVQKDKEIFDIAKIDLEGFAQSLGLPGAPKIKFQKGDDAKKIKNAPRAIALSSDGNSDADESERRKENKNEVRTKYDRMFERQNQGVLSGHYSRLISEDSSMTGEMREVGDEQEDEFLSIKRALSRDREYFGEADAKDMQTPSVELTIDGLKKPITTDSKRHEKLLKSKKKSLKLKGKGKKLVFNDDGEAHEIYELKDERDFHLRGTAEFQRAIFVEEEARRIQVADMGDKHLLKEKRKDKKRKRRNNTSNDSDDVHGPLSFGDLDVEDSLALLASLPTEGRAAQGARKRLKKWFEVDSSEERLNSKGRRHHVEAAELPQSLEDLETVAASILG